MPKKTKNNKDKGSYKLNPPLHHKFISKAGMLPETKKLLLITVVSIAAILILSLLIIFVPKVVGKAFYVPEVNRAGIVDPGVIYENTPFTVTVRANIGGTGTVAIGFILEHSGLSLAGVCEQAVVSKLPAEWGDSFKAITCKDDAITFEHATLNFGAAKTGVFDIAEINFAGALAGTYTLDFTSFDIIDFSDHQPIRLDVWDADVVVSEREEEVVPIAVCGDGIAEAQEECDDNNIISGDGCSADCTIEAGYTCTGRKPSVCTTIAVPEEAAPEEVAPEELPSVEGAKINLKELSMDQVGEVITFNTKLTAKEDLTPFKAITQLENAAAPGVVLLYKIETVGAMAAGETRIIQTIYRLKEGVTQVKKRVIVYDQLPGDTLGCDKLEHIYTVS